MAPVLWKLCSNKNGVLNLPNLISSGGCMQSNDLEPDVKHPLSFMFSRFAL